MKPAKSSKRARRHLAIGIDLGGTTLVGALLDERGKLYGEKVLPVHISKGKSGILKSISGLVAELAKKGGRRVRGIGVGSPGTVDFYLGKVLGSAPNLPEWESVPLKSILQKRFSVPVYVDNDANVATLGEAKLGAGRGYSNFVMLTLGTGIGGGLFLDGKLFRGSFFGAGEIGHMTVDPYGPLCGCGGRGCLEKFSSATAIRMRAEQLITGGARTKIGTLRDVRLGKITTKKVFDSAKRGDEVATSVVDEAMLYLGAAIGSVSNLLSPQVVILGGGVSLAGDFLLERVRLSFELFALPTMRRKVKIRLSELKEKSGLLGAGLMVFD